jgi:hypothetical protein
MTQKNLKNLINYIFLNAGCSLLWTEGFCILDILCGGLGKSKMQFLIKKRFKNFRCIFFFNFWSSKTLILDPDSLIMLDLDPPGSATLCVKSILLATVIFRHSFIQLNLVHALCSIFPK